MYACVCKCSSLLPCPFPSYVLFSLPVVTDVQFVLSSVLCCCCFLGGRGVREGGGASLSFALVFNSYAKMLKSPKCVHGKKKIERSCFFRFCFTLFLF